MGVSWKLAFNYLKNNKKRCFILSISILISTILITTILLLFNSYKEYKILRRKKKRKLGSTDLVILHTKKHVQ